MNSWHPSIVVPASALTCAMSVSMLDLAISVQGERFMYETHRKVLNMYDYIPANSAHKPSVFSAIVKGEMHRLLRTNNSKHTFEKHKQIFLSLRSICHPEGGRLNPSSM